MRHVQLKDLKEQPHLIMCIALSGNKKKRLSKQKKATSFKLFSCSLAAITQAETINKQPLLKLDTNPDKLSLSIMYEFSVIVFILLRQ